MLVNFSSGLNLDSRMKAIRQPRIEPQNTVSREMRMVVCVPHRKY